jgi:hypothetical protein
MKFYSAITKNEIMSFLRKMMELEIIVVSKISQTQKEKYSMFSLKFRIWRERKDDMKEEGW